MVQTVGAWGRGHVWGLWISLQAADVPTQPTSPRVRHADHGRCTDSAHRTVACAAVEIWSFDASVMCPGASVHSTSLASPRLQEISELQKLQKQRLKGAKRKAAEKRAKLKERLSLKMEHPGVASSNSCVTSSK